MVSSEDVNPCRVRREREESLHHGTGTRTVDVDAADADGTEASRPGEPVDFELTDRTSAYALRAPDPRTIRVPRPREARQGAVEAIQREGDGLLQGLRRTVSSSTHRRTRNIRDHRCKPPPNAFRRGPPG